MKLISVIVPCYNEEDTLNVFMETINKTVQIMMNKAKFEIIFVNDGSKDNTLVILKEFSNKYECVKYISFSRNFGKEAAILAGLDHAKGDFNVIIDADLQDPPELIENMYEILKDGYVDCVATRRITRDGEPRIRSFFAKRFYDLINFVSKVKIINGARDFRMINRKMTNAIISLRECNRFSKGIFEWTGFKTEWIEYNNIERAAGITKWSLLGLFFYAMQGIISFSIVPLAFASIIGLFFCIVSFVLIFLIIFRAVFYGGMVAGWPSMACFILFLFGIQLFCTGILSQYVANIYIQSKNRPIYIIDEINV